jgi:ribosomal protein S18 acetylase RimI-like enzyme
MATLVLDAHAELGPRFECAVGDLDWRMYRASTVRPEDNIRLWEDDHGRLVGFAWLITNGDVDLIVYPRAWCGLIVLDMVEWAEKRSREPGAIDRSDRPTVVWSLESNAPLTEAVRNCGLVASGRKYLHLLRSLHAETFAAQVPAGHVIRGVSGREEAAPRAALHRAAFPHSRLTTEVYMQLMQSRRYRQELDVVITAPGGEFAAMALGWLDTRNRLGELEPVGTHPAHRRKGLARAAIQEVMRRLRQSGAEAVVVYADADNAGSVELYQRLGFTVIDASHGFVRPTHP